MNRSNTIELSETLIPELREGEGYLIRTDRVKDPRTGKYYASYSLL